LEANRFGSECTGRPLLFRKVGGEGRGRKGREGYM